MTLHWIFDRCIDRQSLDYDFECAEIVVHDRKPHGADAERTESFSCTLALSAFCHRIADLQRENRDVRRSPPVPENVRRPGEHVHDIWVI
jgi:hypothetical protein